MPRPRQLFLSAILAVAVTLGCCFGGAAGCTGIDVRADDAARLVRSAGEAVTTAAVNAAIEGFKGTAKDAASAAASVATDRALELIRTWSKDQREWMEDWAKKHANDPDSPYQTVALALIAALNAGQLVTSRKGGGAAPAPAPAPAAA